MIHRQSVSFGSLLKCYRAAARLTQEQLAVRARLSPEAVAALERGKRRTPRAATVEQLAAALTLSDAEREKLLVAARPVSTRAVSADRTQTTPSLRYLAAQPTPLIGRASELEAIRRWLVVGGMRELTLTGPAGVGKTRLALVAVAQIADERPETFPDGVTLVDLAPLRDADLVLPTIAQAFGVADIGGVAVLDRLQDVLRERKVLLVLDNFEQVLPAASVLAELLAACPGLRLLVTSRVPLRLLWEQVLRVPPLPVPDLRATLPLPDELARVPAVALFVERARARHADFALGETEAPLVAQLVAQLDGLPLALELAAARLDVLSLPAIARRLEDRLHLLRWETMDLPERQRSLEAAVGWSYDLLSAAERRLFRCLGVFVGHITLDAIAAVVAAVANVGTRGRTLDALLSLAEKSLVLPARPDEEEGGNGDEDGPEPAFGMLETVREYAQEQLAARGELEAARRAHAHYFLALAERADPELRGPGQRAWFLRLEHERDNLHAALRWLNHHDDPAEREAGLRLAGALGWFWWLRGYHAQGSHWLEEALARAPGANPAVRTRGLIAAGALLAQQGALERSRVVLEEALALARQRQDPAAIALALTYLGGRAVFAGDFAASVPVLREALARWQELGDLSHSGDTLFFLGVAASGQGADAEAASLHAHALERSKAAGDGRSVGAAHYNLAMIARQQGDLPRAVEHVRAGLAASVALRDRWLLSVGTLAALTVLGEHPDPAQLARQVGAADALTQATGARFAWLPAWASVARLRERLVGAGWGAAYREGRALPFGDIAALALSLLEDAALAPARPARAKIAFQTSLGRPGPPAWQGGPLSEREREVLGLVALGLTNKAIGQQLFITPSTVNYHLTAIFNKLGVDTRAQAVAVAARRGVL